MITPVEPYVLGIFIEPKEKPSLILDEMTQRARKQEQGHIILEDNGSYEELNNAIGKRLIINPVYQDATNPQLIAPGQQDPHGNEYVLVPRHGIIGYTD